MPEPTTELHWAVQTAIRAICGRLDGYSEFPGATLEVYDVDGEDITMRVHTFGPCGPVEVLLTLALGEVSSEQ